MSRAIRRAAAVLLPLLVLGGPLRAKDTAAVLAILNRRCVECHGPSKQSGKLRLDSLDAVFRGGKSGPAVTAGDAKASLLHQRVVDADEAERMPPEGDPLAEAEIAAIREWIASGARAAASGDAKREVSVVPRPEALPPGFAPVFCIAGDPASPRLAIGRGRVVEVHEIPPAAPDGKEKKKDAPPVEPRLVKVLHGSADLVQSLAFSADGKLLAVGEFRVARVHACDTWEIRAELGPHLDRVLSLQFAADGRRLVAAGGLPTESGQILLWDLESRKSVWTTAPHSDTVFGVALAREGKTIATAAADRTTWILDLEAGKPVRRLEAHTHHVLAVAVSPDGKRAATAGGDEEIKLWDLEKGEYERTLRGHDGAVTAVSFYDQGKRLVSTSGDGTVRAWSWDNDGSRFAFNDAKGCLQGGCFLGGEALYAAAEQAGPVRVYDLEKRRLLFTLGARAGEGSPR